MVMRVRLLEGNGSGEIPVSTSNTHLGRTPRTEGGINLPETRCGNEGSSRGKGRIYTKEAGVWHHVIDLGPLPRFHGVNFRRHVDLTTWIYIWPWIYNLRDSSTEIVSSNNNSFSISYVRYGPDPRHQPPTWSGIPNNFAKKKTHQNRCRISRGKFHWEDLKLLKRSKTNGTYVTV